MTEGQLIIIAMTLGYGLGAIPFGLVLTKLFSGIDIRAIGSGNIGATNVLRTGNKKLAVATLVLDAGKGALAVLILTIMANPELGALAGLGAVLGHCFPIWLRFRGGKGVATGIATLAAINPLLGVLMVTIWLVTAGLFRISSLAAISGYFLTALYAGLFLDLSHIALFVVIAISGLSIVRHHENIRRLIAGQESRISFRSKQ